MRGSEAVSRVLKAKGMNARHLAERTGKGQSTIYNTFANDRLSGEKEYKRGMSYELVEEYIEALGCEIVFRDKETGEIY